MSVKGKKIVDYAIYKTLFNIFDLNNKDDSNIIDNVLLNSIFLNIE